MGKSYSEINSRIAEGSALVLTAEEMIDYVRENGVKKAAKDVDVVTTGTFGAMCSSGAFLNFGHSEPPIKMQKVWLNDVEAYTGLAAVDAYIGASQLSETEGFDYGGSYVIEDLISGKEIELRAIAYGTDCYPRRKLETKITLEDLNQAYLFNPRNAYQNYSAATNSSDRTIYTYMGKLLPDYGNVTYTTSSQLSPLVNDPTFKTIGTGTKIFVAGTEGFVVREGTQHNTTVQKKNGVPTGAAGTLGVTADLKGAKKEFLSAATFEKYGTTLFVGLGVAIPILNEELAKSTSISDEEIFTKIFDYSTPSRSRSPLREVNYSELRSGVVELNGKEVRTSPLASLKVARKVADTLKDSIKKGDFLLTEPVRPLPSATVKPLKHNVRYVKDVLSKVITCSLDSDIESVASLMVNSNTTHIPILDGKKLAGIVTSWDIAKALANKRKRLSEIYTKDVFVADPNESLRVVARRMEEHHISALPVVSKTGEVLGLITSDIVSKFAFRD